jgi:hypothetical protein
MPENIFLPVQNLQRTEIKNFGLCWILFFKHADIDSWPVVDPLSGVINGSLVFKSGAQFYSAQFIEKDRIFIEAQRDSAAGPYVETTVTGVLGGNNLNHITGIMAMMGGKFGCLVQERNGEQRLIGSADAGAKFSWDYTSGNEATSRKRNCKWTFESQYPVPIYQGGNVVINNTLIPVGGNNNPLTGGTFDLLAPAITVGDPGQPLINGDLSYSNAGLVNKKVLVFADGIKIPQTAAPVANKRTVQKVLNSNTVSFSGGVVAQEIIEIYIYS